MARSIDDDGLGARREKTNPGIAPLRPSPSHAGAGVHEIATRLIPDGTAARRSQQMAAREFAISKTIGRFELIREIARGGMGQVFLGRDTKLGRKVAIKFLLHDDVRFLDRFLVEARATARCTHENIVTIFEVGEHDGLPYMVLEFLEGKTLFEVLESKPTLRQFVEIIVPVVRALERAHEHGIVHRDLKPHNIFVTDRGQVKVLDFGIARLVDPDDAELAARATAAIEAMSSEITEADSLVGTVPYMSPEQFGAGEVDHLSDLWAVGILFWRALIGAHPAGSMVPNVLRERVCDLDTPLPSIATHDPSIPSDLVAIVDRCLAKRKPDRYPSATLLLADLQAFLVPLAERSTGDACPYRGLAAFGEADARYFFGRSNEIRTAVAQLESWPLLAVIGPSGAGKSSFIHAGVVPAVRASGGRWQVRVLRPGRAPLHRLAAVIEETLATGEQTVDLTARLPDEPGLFGTMLRAVAARQNRRMLIVVDQLEELFTLCDDDRVRHLFLCALLAAADDPGSPIRLVLAMRADFLDRLAAHGAFASELSRGLFFLTAPDPQNMRETLERPAELAGHTFEDPRIVDDMMQVATSRGALPLLSFAASRLWDARDRERKLLTVDGYNSIGGVGGAFARHADAVAAAVPPQRQPLLRAIVTRLVTPEGTRAVVDRAELLSLSPDPGEVELILDQLVRARLIHAETDEDQIATVEIVHEVLITEWPTLRRWLEDSQAMRAFTHELRQAANQWHAHGRRDDLVWRGATAQEAIGHAKRHVLDLSTTEKDYLAAIKNQIARGRRRKALAFASIVTALGLVLAGASVAVVRIKLAESDAQDKARQAELDRKTALDATGQLQGKIDALEAEKKAREVAQAERLAEQRRRKGVEDALAETKELSREQLLGKVAEKEAETRKAEAERRRVIQVNEELTAAKQQLQSLLAQERARRERAERESRQKGIVTDDLLGAKKNGGN